MRERLGLLSITVEAEKEVVQIMVSKQQQEEVFAAMFTAGKLDTPGMGIMFITPLERAVSYVPPAVRRKINLMQKIAHQEGEHNAM